MAFSMIAAMGKNRELGKAGGLVWDLPGDLKYFRDTTMGHPIFMGHRTFDSLPKVLPGRKPYVLTRVSPEEFKKATDKEASPSLWPDTSGNVIIVNNLTEFTKNPPEEEMFVIGGGMVYWEMLKYCDKLYLTEVDAEDETADTFFPEFDKNNYTRTEVGKGADHGVNYTFVIYTKK